MLLLSMNDALRQALTPNRIAVRTALADAERRLVELRAEEAELEQLIARARKELEMKGVPVGRVTLHEAMVHVLREHGGKGMRAREIANAVTDSGLYRKKDGSTLEPNQIHARLNRHGDLFTKNGSLITLKQT
jgi:hypothetical protein